MVIRALATAFAACLLSASPAQAAPVPGVTDTEITIGITGPLSGPAAAWGTIALASEAYARYVNDQGGVHGRKLKIVLKDDGYNPGRAVANMNEMKDQVFAKQPKAKIRTVFQAYPDYADEAEFLTQQAARLENVKKLGFFGQNDDFGKEALEGVKRGLAKTPGTTLVGEVFYEVTDRELGTHALKMKESGAEAVLFYSTATHAAGLVKEMAKVGYRPKIFCSFTLYARDTMFRLLGDLYDGAYFDSVAKMRGEPAADRIVEIVTRIDPKLKGREGFAVQGAADVMILVEGLKKAGRDLTREKFVKAMETVKDWTGEGRYAPMSFGPDRHHGQNTVRLMRAGKAADLGVTQITDYQPFPTKF